MRNFRLLAAAALAAVFSLSLAMQADPPDIETPIGEVQSELDIEELEAEAEAEAEIDVNDVRRALAEHVEGLVRAHQREHGLGALTVAVIADDELWLARGYGLADIESDRPVLAEETLFRIGSVSKTFTWTAVMMLVERGQLDLDADINGYIGNFAVTPAFGQPVTMRDIMHHRAGFEDTLRLFAVADDDPRSLAELLSGHQPQRVYPPGARTSYSNWASALAAQVVENITERPYGEFLREEILDPLGMVETTWLAPANMDDELRSRLATGYKSERGALGLQGYMQIGAYWPAGGMASTAVEMARWMRFHLNGGELDGVQLMSTEAHAQMWTRGFNDRPLATDLAHGFQDRPYRGVRTLGHAGGTAAFLTNMILAPEFGLGVFVSHNSTHTGSVITQLPDLVIDHFVGLEYRPLEIREDEAGADRLAEYAGSYLNNRRVFSTFSALLGGLNLFSVKPVSADALVIGGMGQNEYYRRMTEHADLFENVEGGRIAFLRDEGGEIVAVADSMGVHTAERLDWWRSPTALFLALGLACILALTTTLGGWRRVGRGVYTGFSARMAGGVALLGVLSLFAFLASIGLLIAELAEFDLSQMPDNYPAPMMFVVHYAGWVVAGAAGLMMLAQWPAWSGSGWGWFKRLHFALFTLAMLFLAVQLWQWRVIGAPVI